MENSMKFLAKNNWKVDTQNPKRFLQFQQKMKVRMM
jgi:hypothetical protein